MDRPRLPPSQVGGDHSAASAAVLAQGAWSSRSARRLVDRNLGGVQRAGPRPAGGPVEGAPYPPDGTLPDPPSLGSDPPSPMAEAVEDPAHRGA